MDSGTVDMGKFCVIACLFNGIVQSFIEFTGRDSRVSKNIKYFVFALIINKAKKIINLYECQQNF